MDYKTSNYKINDFYSGGYSSLDPAYGNFSGYRANASKLGVSTDPRTANILQSISTSINPGQKNIELEWLQPDIMDSVPKQHLKEVNRMAKLTGTDISVHGPVVEASGMSKNGFTDSNREAAERQIVSTLERAQEINPNSVNVVFHSSAALPSPEIRKVPEEERKRRGLDSDEEIDKMLIIDQETGNINYVDKSIRHDLDDPKFKKGREISAEENIRIMNDTRWDDSLTQLIDPIERANNILENEGVAVMANNIRRIKEENGLEYKDLPEQHKAILMREAHAHAILGDVKKHANSLFERAYKYGTPEDKKAVEEIQKNFGENLKRDEGKKNPLLIYSGALDNLVSDLRKKIKSVQVIKPADEFSLEKSGQTFGNAAFSAFKKYKDKTPVISIENPPAGFALSRGEDIKNLVEKSREQFVERAVAEGMDKNEAKKAAEKTIGATWDVGHINMMRKFGFDDKDLVEETKKVAPYVKHVHLSDNFGLEHTELPMGMGNVPLKEMMDKLGKSGKEAKKIVEAGNWFQHFRTSPMAQSFENMGVPFYAQGKTPYFNQTSGYEQGYFSGMGQSLPQMNYQTFGAGFSQLPTELGGSSGSKGNRLSGTPME